MAGKKGQCKPFKAARKIGGKTYRKTGKPTTKGKAKADAKKLRSQGKKATVITNACKQSQVYTRG